MVIFPGVLAIRGLCAGVAPGFGRRDQAHPKWQATSNPHPGDRLPKKYRKQYFRPASGVDNLGFLFEQNLTVFDFCKNELVFKEETWKKIGLY